MKHKRSLRESARAAKVGDRLRRFDRLQLPKHVRLIDVVEADDVQPEVLEAIGRDDDARPIVGNVIACPHFACGGRSGRHLDGGEVRCEELSERRRAEDLLARLPAGRRPVGDEDDEVTGVALPRLGAGGGERRLKDAGRRLPGARPEDDERDGY